MKIDRCRMRNQYNFSQEKRMLMINILFEWHNATSIGGRGGGVFISTLLCGLNKQNKKFAYYLPTRISWYKDSWTKKSSNNLKKNKLTKRTVKRKAKLTIHPGNFQRSHTISVVQMGLCEVKQEEKFFSKKTSNFFWAV